MSLVALTASKVFTPLEVFEPGIVLIEDETIRAVGPLGSFSVPPTARVVELGDRLLAPGFVDVHIHGGAGHDVMEGTPEALEAVARHVVRYGTTSFVPTTLSAPPEILERSLAGLGRAIRSANSPKTAPQAQPLGIHLEGPFLSPRFRGAHPREHLHEPSIELLGRFLDAADGSARILTLAPELDGAPELQAYAQQRGLRVGLGHSGASFEETIRAVDAGASHGVHVFNAMRPFSHRDPGILGALLTDDRVFAEVIADGVHVDPAALRLLIRAKSVERIVLVTDAVSATGMPPGHYRLGEMEIQVETDSRTGRLCCRNREGALAGSILIQAEAVANISALNEVSLANALRMATYNPARLLGIEDRKGAIRPGADADLVILKSDLAVAGTVLAGRLHGMTE